MRELAEAIRAQPDAASREQIARVLEALAGWIERQAGELDSLQRRVSKLEAERRHQQRAERFSL